MLIPILKVAPAQTVVDFAIMSKYYHSDFGKLELFNLQVVIQVRVRYYYCDYPDCPQRTFSGSLAIAGPNARKTHEVQQRILKDSRCTCPVEKPPSF